MDRKVTYELNEDDAVAAARIAWRRRMRSPRVASALILLYIAIIAILAVILGRSKLDQLLIAAVIAPPIAFWIIARWVIPAMARTNYRQSAGLKGPAELSWSEERFAIDHARGSLRLQWHELSGAVEGENVLLLFQSDMIYNLVPLGGMTESQRQDLLARAIRR